MARHLEPATGDRLRPEQNDEVWLYFATSCLPCEHAEVLRPPGDITLATFRNSSLETMGVKTQAENTHHRKFLLI